MIIRKAFAETCALSVFLMLAGITSASAQTAKGTTHHAHRSSRYSADRGKIYTIPVKLWSGRTATISFTHVPTLGEIAAVVDQADDQEVRSGRAKPLDTDDWYFGPTVMLFSNDKYIGAGLESKDGIVVRLHDVATITGLQVEYVASQHVATLTSGTGVPISSASPEPSVPDPTPTPSLESVIYVPGDSLASTQGHWTAVRNSDGYGLRSFHFRDAVITNGAFSAELEIAPDTFEKTLKPIRCDFLVIFYDAGGNLVKRTTASVYGISSSGGSYELKTNVGDYVPSAQNVIVRFSASWTMKG